MTRTHCHFLLNVVMYTYMVTCCLCLGNTWRIFSIILVTAKLSLCLIKHDAEREAEAYLHIFSTSRPYLFAVEERAFWIGGWVKHLSRCVIWTHWSIVVFWQRYFSPYVVLKMLISVSYVTFQCEWFVTVHTWCWKTRNKRTLVTMKCIFLFEVVMTLGIHMTILIFCDFFYPEAKVGNRHIMAMHGRYRVRKQWQNKTTNTSTVLC
jgi:hypothetical protein